MPEHLISMSITYDVVAATVTGTMVGNEIAVAAFVHPQLRRMSGRVHAQAASMLASVLGKFMPFWYALALILIIGAAFEHRPLANGTGLLIMMAAILLAVAIVFSVAQLVPINNRIARMDPEHPHATWLQDRCRWDRFHRARVVILTMSLVLLLTGIIQSSIVAAS
ncbi:DUF1772 domain-containing protein [Edaphobacter acidisoli]|nr:DUF1772 domain-containing protein [Edaphobacter acidisoli]